MTSMALQVVQQRTIYLPGWDMELIVIQTGDGCVWFPIRYFCAALGIQPRFQVDRLREHAVLGRLVAQLPIQTAGGRQSAWCIQKRGIAFWLGGLQLERVRAAVRPRLLDLQEEIVTAAERVLFGEVESTLVTRDELLALTDEVNGMARHAIAVERRLGDLEERVIVPERDE